MHQNEELFFRFRLAIKEKLSKKAERRSMKEDRCLILVPLVSVKIHIFFGERRLISCFKNCFNKMLRFLKIEAVIYKK